MVGKLRKSVLPCHFCRLIIDTFWVRPVLFSFFNYTQEIIDISNKIIKFPASNVPMANFIRKRLISLDLKFPIREIWTGGAKYQLRIASIWMTISRDMVMLLFKSTHGWAKIQGNKLHWVQRYHLVHETNFHKCAKSANLLMFKFVTKQEPKVIFTFKIL